MIKACTLFFVAAFFTASPKAQVKTIEAGGFKFQISTVDTALNTAFYSSGQMPEFPGGITGLVAFAKRELYYSESAIKDHIEGNVILQYKINSEGKVTNKAIFKSLRNDLDIVCLKMLDKMPDWKPARLSHIPVETNFKWTITFVLR